MYSYKHTLSKGDRVSEANKMMYGDHQSEGNKNNKSKRERKVERKKEAKGMREREQHFEFSYLSLSNKTHTDRFCTPLYMRQSPQRLTSVVLFHLV